MAVGHVHVQAGCANAVLSPDVVGCFVPLYRRAENYNVPGMDDASLAPESMSRDVIELAKGHMFLLELLHADRRWSGNEDTVRLPLTRLCCAIEGSKLSLLASTCPWPW